MKRALILISLFTVINSKAQSFVGAWERYHTAENGEELKTVVIFSSGYQVRATYAALTGRFVSTNGGTWKLTGNTMTELLEFDSSNPERVGTEVTFGVFVNDSTMGIVGTEVKFKRIDRGSSGKLAGAWFMSGRVRDGVMQLRDTDSPRKTLKILSGRRFQWIAFNTATKQFFGTGGGTYTTTDDTYTERIAFFSKDNTRVGQSLKFAYRLTEGNWHHQGLSSKGKPIHEIWRVRN